MELMILNSQIVCIISKTASRVAVITRNATSSPWRSETTTASYTRTARTLFRVKHVPAAKSCSHGYGGERKLDKSTRGVITLREEDLTKYLADNLDKVCGNTKGETFHISVLTLQAERFLFEVVPTDTILCVKAKLRVKRGYPIREMALNFAGKELKDDTTLAYNNIGDKSTLMLNLGRGINYSLPDKHSYDFEEIKCKIPTGKTIGRFLHPLLGC